jgi:hypothetical protein
MENKLKTITPAIGKLAAIKKAPRQVRKPMKPVKQGDEPSLANWKPPFPVKK